MSEQAVSDAERQLEARDVLGVRQLIQRGIEVERFLLHTPTGKAMVQRAELELEAATDALRTVDPFDGKAVAQAQFDCRVPGAVLTWLAQAIQEGQNAERQYIAADEAQG